MIYDHQRVIWLRTLATDSQIGDVLKQRDDALAEAVRLKDEAAHWQAEYHKHSLDFLPMGVVIDALIRISTEAATLPDPTILQLARRALLTIQGER